MPGLLCADDLVLCDELGEDLKVMVGCFVKVCRRRGLKVNAEKGKMMVYRGGGGGDWSVESVWMGCSWSKCQSLNI